MINTHEGDAKLLFRFLGSPLVTDDALVTMGTIKCHHQPISPFSRSGLRAHVLRQAPVESHKHTPDNESFFSPLPTLEPRFNYTRTVSVGRNYTTVITVLWYSVASR